MPVKKLHILLPLALLACAVVLRIPHLGALEELRNRVFDAFQTRDPRIYRATPVRVVDIDDESLARLGQWPWPRNLLSRLVERLSKFGAAVVAFDAVFAEPDRSSPALAIRSWPATTDTRSLRAGQLPDYDRIFAKGLARAPVVLGFVLVNKKNGVIPALKASFAHGGDDPKNYLENSFAGAVANLPELERATSGNGSFNIIADPDGIIRRVPLLFRLGDRIYPSLVIEALRVAQKAQGVAVKCSGSSGETAFGQHTGIVKVKIGTYSVPTDAQGRVWVHYSGPAPRTVSAWRVLDRGFDGRGLSGAIVFVGTSSEGIKDQRATPINPTMSGVEIHAQLAEQIVLNSFLQRPDWADGAEIIYMLVLGLGLIFLLPRLGALWCAVLGGATILAAFALSGRAYTSWRWLLDPVFPSLTALLVYLSSSLLGYLQSEEEKRQVRRQFSRYMSSAFVNELAQHPERLKLGGELKEMTLLFADIRGFTTISEQFDPRGLTQFINRFFTPMTDIILTNRGTIDKYIGDCIMAFWNAPLDDSAHAANACRAALAMREKLKALNRQWREEAKAGREGLVPINVGIGINTGACCVGNMGSEHQFNYSVLGDEVNLASRLEGQSETYGVDIVIGPKTSEQATDFATVELDLLRVQGKTKPVRVFALLGDATLKASAEFSRLVQLQNDMLRAYRGRDFSRARGLLSECRGVGSSLGLDGLYAVYAQRIAAYEARPPEANWDGVYTATTK